jgi:ATP-dependent RNA helicase DHX36
MMHRYAAQSRKRQLMEGAAAPVLCLPSPQVAAAQQALRDFEASALSRAPVHARANEGVGRAAAPVSGDADAVAGLQFDEAEEAALQAAAAAHARAHAAALADLSSSRARLPVHTHRVAILSSLNEQVALVCGETGCGKTTQVPQFILEDAAACRRLSCTRILCTQPRRISATSVAQRVASERCEQLGTSIGFSIRMQQQLPRRRGSATFCTTGVVLRLLQSRDALADVSHLIIDEVHERDINTDFLLAAVKKLLPHRPHLKLILMSALVPPHGSMFVVVMPLHVRHH